MIEQIQPYEVLNAWPKVRPILQRAVDAGPLDYTCEDLLLEALNGRQQLWVGPNLVAMTQIQHFPQGKTLMMTYCAGEGMEQWFQPLWDKMREYKTTMGCRDIRAGGRKGWARMFPDSVEKRVLLIEK